MALGFRIHSTLTDNRVSPSDSLQRRCRWSVQVNVRSCQASARYSGAIQTQKRQHHNFAFTVFANAERQRSLMEAFESFECSLYLQRQADQPDGTEHAEASVLAAK